MKVQDSFNPKQIESVNQGMDPLKQLGERVSEALKHKQSQQGPDPEFTAKVKNYLAKISPNPIAGAIIQNTIV